MSRLPDVTLRSLEALCQLAYLGAAGYFCKEIFHSSRGREALFAVSSFLIWLLLDLANRQHPMLFLLFMLVNHGLFLVLVQALFQAEREKKILAASLLMTVGTLVRNFCGSLLSCLVLVVQHTGKGILLPLLGEGESALIVCAGFGLSIGAIYWMTKHLAALFNGKTRKWYVILSLPLLALLVIYDVASWGASNGIMVRSAGNLGLYYDQIFSYMEFGILAALSLFAAGVFVLGMEQIDLEQKKSGQYNAQIRVYKMLTEEYEQSERLRHDMKNHIIALSALSHSRDWEKLGNYLRKMEEGCLKTGGELTGNRALDALFYQKQKRAEKEGILWKYEVELPRAWGIPEFDLCVLFGNILDNALEACERLQSRRYQESCETTLPFVHIQARVVKRCFFLEVKNSMDRAEETHKRVAYWKRQDRETALSQGQGIGLWNIRDVVYRYHGVMNVEEQKGSFRISILMPLDAVPQDAAVHDRKATV